MATNTGTSAATANADENTTDPIKNGEVIFKSTSTTSLPMFVPSSMIENEEEANNLDLDDLFRDCYFGDFTVPVLGDGETNAIIAPTTAIPPPSTAAAPLPPPPTTTTLNTLTPIPAPTPVSIQTTTSAPIPTLAPPAQASTTTSAPPPPPPPVIAPLVSNTRFYSNQPAVPPVTSSSAVTTAKRKAEEALDQATADEAANAPPAKKLDLSEPSTKALTDQQKVERRERNRKHAKRSRLRKKFLLESLQDQINGLMSEIDSLKDIIKKECPDKADKLLQSVNGPRGNFTPLPMPSGFGPVKALMEPDFRLMSALSGSQQNFAISDPSLPDNPIVYVSQGFLELTGYTLDQVLGRNCRFLQGPGTDQSAVDIIRKGVREGVDTSVCLLNYKADGSPFWNQFFVAALRDAENNVVNFVGVQCEVSKAVVEKQMAQKELEAEKAIKEE